MCRHLPIAVRLQVDQAYVNTVLSTMANNKLRMQITQVEWNHVPRSRAMLAGGLPGAPGSGGFGFPDLPTASEVFPDMFFEGWHGALGPGGMPREVVLRMNREMNQALADPQIAARLNNAGLVPQNATPEAFLDLMEADQKRWGGLVRDLNLKLE